MLWRINQGSWNATGSYLCPRSSGSSVKKVAKKREEKLFPPPLSPLLDEPVHRRHNSDNGSFSQETNITNTSQTSSSSSSVSKHRKNENKSSSNPKGICVSNRPQLLEVNKIKLTWLCSVWRFFLQYLFLNAYVAPLKSSEEWIFAELGKSNSCKFHF